MSTGLIEPWGPDEIEITREMHLECEEMDADNQFCGWSGKLTLDGFEYMGIEYFQWECPICKSLSTTEDKVR